MTDKLQRAAQRDMDPSGIAKILEIFFGGNQMVDAAVLFDKTGETVDYHTVLDPYEMRLIAAYCGILFESARYRMEWLEKARLQLIEFSTEKFDIVTVPVSGDFFLTLLVRPGALDDALRDAIVGVQEALLEEIGY